MSETVSFRVSIDKDIKEVSEALFHDLGMDMTTAINVFLRQAIRSGGFPFEIKLNQPNRETLFALLEAEELESDAKVKRFTDADEALQELKQ